MVWNNRLFRAATCVASLTVATAANAADLSAVKAEKPAGPASIWEQEKLTGDWGGARTALSNRGIDIEINYVGETLSNLSGGLKTGTQYQGLLELSVDTDFQKMLNWAGMTGHVTVFQIHDINGRIGPDFVGSIGDPSNIDAFPTTRLFTVWLQQSFWGDKVSLRAGQLAADDEFLLSTTAGGLIGGTFGWANSMAANLPAGGPAYPLATPGVRLAINPTENTAFLAAVFNGDPAGKNCGDQDPQICNRHGDDFSLTGGAFTIAELQYNINQGKNDTGLAASYKIGGWYHSGEFADQRYGVNAGGQVVRLTNPGVAGPYFHRGDAGIYGVIDQMFWRSGAQSASFFLRAAATSSDENLISYYVDGGVGVKSPFVGRDDDTLTFGFAYSSISSAARDADRDIAAIMAGYPIRDYELQFEVSYLAQITPWWSIQPDVQYFVHPGGNVPNPRSPTGEVVRNSFVVGARSTVAF